MPREIIDGTRSHFAHLQGGDRLGRRSAFPRRLGADFDEHDRAAILAHDVDFTMPRAIAPIKNCVPARDQLPNREIFAYSSEFLTRVRHAGRRSQIRGRTPPTPPTVAAVAGTGTLELEPGTGNLEPGTWNLETGNWKLE